MANPEVRVPPAPRWRLWERKEVAPRAGPTDANGEAAPTPPWDWKLRFRDAQLEAEYWASRRTDSQTSARLAVTLIGIAVMTALWVRLVPIGDGATARGHSELFLLVGLRIAALVMAWRWREVYESNRLAIVALLRLQTVVYACRVLSAPIELIWTAGTLSHHLLLRSVVFPMVSVVAKLKLPFPEHLCVQGAGCLISILWTTDMYCRGWLGPSGDMGQYMSAYNKVGETIERTIMRASNFGFPSPCSAGLDSPAGDAALGKPHSCWLVVAFFQVLGGFVLPSMYHYCVESFFRMRFLSDRAMDAKERRRHAWMWCESMLMMVWMAVVAVMATWTALKCVEELGQRTRAILGNLEQGRGVCAVNDLGLG